MDAFIERFPMAPGTASRFSQWHGLAMVGELSRNGTRQMANTPNSSIFMGFSIIDQPFWDTPILGTPLNGRLPICPVFFEVGPWPHLQMMRPLGGVFGLAGQKDGKGRTRQFPQD